MITRTWRIRWKHRRRSKKLRQLDQATDKAANSLVCVIWSIESWWDRGSNSGLLVLSILSLLKVEPLSAQRSCRREDFATTSTSSWTRWRSNGGLSTSRRSSAGLARLELQAAKTTATNHGNYSSRSREWQRSSWPEAAMELTSSVWTKDLADGNRCAASRSKNFILITSRSSIEERMSTKSKSQSLRWELNKTKANRSILLPRCSNRLTELWVTSLSEWMRNKLDVASTSGTMLSIKRTRNEDSSEKRFSTGKDAPLVPHLGDGLKPRSNRGSKSLQQN